MDFWLPGDRRAISTKVQVITLDEAQGGRIIMRMRCNLDEAARVRIERFLAGRKDSVFSFSTECSMSETVAPPELFPLIRASYSMHMLDLDHS